MARICGLDGCEAPAELMCTRCRSVRYCSRGHQAKAWTVHKTMCVAPVVASDPDSDSETSSETPAKEHKLAMNWAAGVHKQGERDLARVNDLAVFGVCFTPDGKRLVSANGEGTTYVMKVSNGVILKKLQVDEKTEVKSPTGASFGICSVDVCPGGPNPEDAELIVTGSYDDHLRVWSSKGNLLRDQKLMGAHQVMISPSCRQILVSVETGLMKDPGVRVGWLDLNQSGPLPLF